MATGPENYRLSEVAIENAKAAEGGSHQERFHLDVALVRAMLANAAATAMASQPGGGMSGIDFDAWDIVCGTHENDTDEDAETEVTF